MVIQLLETYWNYIIAFYFVLFWVITFFRFPEERVGIVEDGKIQIRQLGRWLNFASTIPTGFVLIGLAGSGILAILSASGECHPSHGWPCETPPDFTFAYCLGIFKSGVAWMQVATFWVSLGSGALFAVSYFLWPACTKLSHLFVRVCKATWHHSPFRW